jgi:hypothetical protein
MINTQEAHLIGGFMIIEGSDRRDAIDTIRKHHYTHSVPSGKSYYFTSGDVIVVIAIPANKNITGFLLGRDTNFRPVWELSRLWAPDGHGRNDLSRALSVCVGDFKKVEPTCPALVSYADPNVGHSGHVYRACSWVPCGQSSEGRYYVAPDGTVVSRRKFHSGSNSLTKAEIARLGYRELRLPGKMRYAKGLSRSARKAIAARKHIFTAGGSND